MNKNQTILESLKAAVVGTRVVHNFRVMKIYNSKPISRSFHHLEEDYDKEFK